MKTISLLVVVAFLTNVNSWAQSSYNNEADSIECTQNFTTFSDSFESGNQAEAIKYWRLCFSRCPKVSKNLYINGAKLVESLIKSESDIQRKEQLIDTLFLIYEVRVDNFGEEGKVLGYKAEDLYKYRPGEADLAYQMFEKSIRLEGNNSRGKVLSTYLQVTVERMKKGQAEKTDVAEIYGLASQIIDYNLNEEPDDKFYLAARKVVEDIYTKEVNLDCDGLTNLFRQKFEENQSDPDFLKRLKTLLEKRDCKKTELYNLTIQALVASDPTSVSFEKMAEYYQSNNDVTKAIEYYKKAIAKETSKTRKAELYYKLAELTSTMKGQTLSVMYCNLAVENSPSYAKPYLLIAKQYIAGSARCGKDSKFPEFMQKTMYWAAADKCEIAKNLDASLAPEADKIFAECEKNFPTLEEITFQGLQVGSTYNIDCWIKSTTTVRINNGN